MTARGGAHEPAHRPLRVLLVDDDEDYTTFVKRLLARLGLMDSTLDVVHGERAAIGALERTPYDIVVSDYELQPGDGLRVLQHARDLTPKARRILLTSAPDKALRNLAHQDPLVHGLWDKRWEPGTIRQRLNDLLQQVA